MVSSDFVGALLGCGPQALGPDLLVQGLPRSADPSLRSAQPPQGLQTCAEKNNKFEKKVIITIIIIIVIVIFIINKFS